MTGIASITASYSPNGELLSELSIRMHPDATEDQVAAAICTLVRTVPNDPQLRIPPFVPRVTVSNQDPAATHVINRNELATEPVDPNIKLRNDWGY